MKAALENLIATLEHVVQSLNEDRDHDYVKENPREYDEFIHDLGKDRMKAKAILESVKYQGDLEEWRINPLILNVGLAISNGEDE